VTQIILRTWNRKYRPAGAGSKLRIRELSEQPAAILWEQNNHEDKDNLGLTHLLFECNRQRLRIHQAGLDIPCEVPNLRNRHSGYKGQIAFLFLDGS
jgi:hypothetical protein